MTAKIWIYSDTHDCCYGEYPYNTSTEKAKVDGLVSELRGFKGVPVWAQKITEKENNE